MSYFQVHTCSHCGKIIDDPKDYNPYVQSTNDTRLSGRRLSIKNSSIQHCYCKDCYKKRIHIKRVYLWITIALMLAIIGTLIILNELCNRRDAESVSIPLVFVLIGLPFINLWIYRLRIDRFNNL